MDPRTELLISLVEFSQQPANFFAQSTSSATTLLVSTGFANFLAIISSARTRYVAIQQRGI